MASFPWLHQLHRLRRLHHLCSIVRIFDEKRSRNHFRPPQDDAKRKLTQVQPLDQFCKAKAHPTTASGSVLEVLLELLDSSQRVFLTPGAGSEALRSGPWRRFRGSTGSAICVPFCAFLMKKRDRNHVRPPQDDPKAAGSQSTGSEAISNGPVRKRGSTQPPVVAFPGLRLLHRLQLPCSSLRILGEKRIEIIFVPSKMTPK